MTDASLAALLAGVPQAEESAAMGPAADVVAALRAAPAWDELAGEAAALAEFRSRRAPVPGHVGLVRGRRARGRRGRVASRLSARAVVAATAAAVGVGSLATAAYAGALPPPIQRLAHAAIGAPAAVRGGLHAAGALRSGGGAGAACLARGRSTGAPHGAARRGSDGAAPRPGDGGSCGPARLQPTRHPAGAGCWRPAPVRTPARRTGTSRQLGGWPTANGKSAHVQGSGQQGSGQQHSSRPATPGESARRTAKSGQPVPSPTTTRQQSGRPVPSWSRPVRSPARPGPLPSGSCGPARRGSHRHWPVRPSPSPSRRPAPRLSGRPVPLPGQPVPHPTSKPGGSLGGSSGSHHSSTSRSHGSGRPAARLFVSTPMRT